MFWQKNPALLLGLHLLIAAAIALRFEWVYFVPILLFWLPFQKTLFLQLVGALLLGILSFWQIKHTASFREPSQERLEGLAHFSISSLQVQQSPFQRSLVYKGKIRRFESHLGEVLQEIPCQIYMPLANNRPQANRDYLIAGALCKSPHGFQFKPQKKVLWNPLSGTFCLAEWRYQIKEKIRAYLKLKIPNPQSAHLLCTLATGDIDERRLSLEFGKLGMQHILAVSGFHFSLIAGFFYVLLRCFFSPKITDLFVLLALSGYFFLIGSSPSTIRSWTAISVFLIGRLCALRCSALNALGVGLIVEICIDPQAIFHMGFQFSFLCTLAILIGYSVIHDLLSHLLPIRTYKEVIRMPTFDQCFAIISHFMRKALALNCAVHVFAIPVVLLLFHKFPLLSFFYNFFFPALISISLLLLCCTLSISFFPPLANMLHQINSSYTSFLLDFSSHSPANLEFFIRVKSIPFSVVILFISALFFGLVWRKNKLV